MNENMNSVATVVFVLARSLSLLEIQISGIRK